MTHYTALYVDQEAALGSNAPSINVFIYSQAFYANQRVKLNIVFWMEIMCSHVRNYCHFHHSP